MKFKLKDIANLDDAMFYIEGTNPHNVHGFIIHDHGFVVTVVFAEHVQDALDEAVDRDKLDSFLIEEKDYAEYGVWTDNDISAHLGNAGEPFDITALDVVEFPMQKFREQLMETEVVV